GILTTEEVNKLFSSLDIWDNDIFAYAGNLLASCTGMRSREVAAIRGINLKKDHLEISESFDEMFGMKPTKTHDSRKLPLPQKVLDVLHSIKRGDDDYLFTLNGKKPVNQHFFLYALYDALEKIGVTKEERIKRNIVFHSWRHFLNSQLLANNISETKTQKITGHKTLLGSGGLNH
ncbi:MAG: tyrosine-type recombinase/integrase, partial [Sphaerochaeta sp.]